MWRRKNLVFGRCLSKVSNISQGVKICLKTTITNLLMNVTVNSIAALFWQLQCPVARFCAIPYFARFYLYNMCHSCSTLYKYRQCTRTDRIVIILCLEEAPSSSPLSYFVNTYLVKCVWMLNVRTRTVYIGYILMWKFNYCVALQLTLRVIMQKIKYRGLK